MKQSHSPNSPRKSVNWNGPLRAALLLALALPLLAPQTNSPKSGKPVMGHENAHPALLQIAAQRPDTKVSVIVQKATKSNAPEAAVAQLGGLVTQDLSIINAFSANLTAGAAAKLAGSSDVRYISLDAPLVETVAPCPAPCIDVENLASLYPKTIGADRLWNSAPYLQGQGIGVAVLDSGVNSNAPDLRAPNGNSRLVAQVKYNSNSNNMADRYGHGTHIAGIIGGNGAASGGRYIGVAPKVNLISVKVSDEQGSGRTSDLVAGLAWVLYNQQRYNIRVVNISLNSSVAESYHTSAIDAACEVLWINGIVVVASAGNNGTSQLFPPANDPFVITVGATESQGTVLAADDTTTAFSAYGTTSEGILKPDLVAPGRAVTSLLASSSATLPSRHPDALASGFPGSDSYFRMSGTSVAAPIVAGAVALLLQDEPNLTPDQVKYRLKATATRLNSAGSGAGQLDIYAAVNGTTTQADNVGTPASLLIWDELLHPIVWSSVNWNSVNWNSVNWNSVNWNSVNWSSDYWGN